MSALRRAVRGAAVSVCLSAAAGALAVVPSVLLAAPASAAGDEVEVIPGTFPTGDMSLAEGLLIYLLAPLAILLGIALLVALPSLVRAPRYRPGRGWGTPPVWFAGPPDPQLALTEAAQGAAGTDVVKGGAGGSW